MAVNKYGNLAPKHPLIRSVAIVLSTFACIAKGRLRAVESSLKRPFCATAKRDSVLATGKTGKIGPSSVQSVSPFHRLLPFFGLESDGEISPHKD